MGAAIGQILPLAVGVALSPVPIIAVALMLMSQRARLNGPLFVIGWLIGLAVIGVVVLAVAGPDGRGIVRGQSEEPPARDRRLQQLTISAGTPRS
jgi:hypothetical protein